MNQPCSPALPARRLALMAALGLLSASLLGPPRDAAAQGLPTAKPEQVGLSSEGLAKIGDWMRAEVAAKKIPGATS